MRNLAKLEQLAQKFSRNIIREPQLQSVKGGHGGEHAEPPPNS